MISMLSLAWGLVIGHLSYHYRTPIANPKVLKQLLKILLGLDSAFKIYPSLGLNFYYWGLRFLWQCLPKKSQHSATMMRNLGLLAQQRLDEMIDATKLSLIIENKRESCTFIKIKNRCSQPQIMKISIKSQLLFGREINYCNKYQHYKTMGALSVASMIAMKIRRTAASFVSS